jgi:hypothetical protein
MASFLQPVEHDLDLTTPLFSALFVSNGPARELCPGVQGRVAGATLNYDAGGNLLSGFGGRTITYDGDNRPSRVTIGGVHKDFVYGVDGAVCS